MSDLIEAISRGCKGTLADGAVRYVIEIEPRFAAEAAALFGMPGTALAIATLKDGADKPAKEEKPKGGALSILAAQWCNDIRFWDWVEVR